jgi:hypothetical protein
LSITAITKSLKVIWKIQELKVQITLYTLAVIQVIPNIWQVLPVKDSSQIDSAQSIFRQNAVIKTYLFENMSIDEANYDTIKKYIDARNKAEIHNSPDIKIKTSSDGMNSEVKF